MTTTKGGSWYCACGVPLRVCNIMSLLHASNSYQIANVPLSFCFSSYGTNFVGNGI